MSTYTKKGYGSRAHVCTPDHFVLCEQCGAPFHRKSDWKQRTARTCSNECRLKLLNSTQNRYKKPMEERARSVTAKGYVRVAVPGRGLIMEHRYVMELLIGRPLGRAERVHHRNGNRADNRPENLVLCASQSEHIRVWHPDLIRNFKR